MRRQLLTGLLVTIVLTVLLGVVYPLLVTGISTVAFKSRADGSLVTANGKLVGSSLIGQSFTDKDGNPLVPYFQPRPSAAGSGYDPTSSGGSNLGLSNNALACADPANPCDPKTFTASVAGRAKSYRELNGLPAGTPVPVDAVTASGSGLDPDISLANALDQAPRVAQARHLSSDRVAALVRSHLNARPWGFLGEDTVNVLDLNLALDAMR